MTTELAPAQQLLDVQTGELLPATISNAARVLESARLMKQRINDLVAETTEYVRAESERQGIKTLRVGDRTLTLSGGVAEDYDAVALMELLSEAGCPQERVEEAVQAVVTYKVNRAVLRQLAAANPDYKAAIELARCEVEKPYRVAVR